jgi:hypothetical protein
MVMFKIRSRNFAAKKRSFEDKRRFNPHRIGGLLSDFPNLRGHFTAYRMDKRRGQSRHRRRDFYFEKIHWLLEGWAMCGYDNPPSPIRRYGPPLWSWRGGE